MKHLASLSVVLLMATGSPLLGERLYTLGARLSAVASVDDNPQVRGTNLRQTINDLTSVYGFFPSLYLGSQGPDSTFSVSYGFALNRVDSSQPLNSESHTFSGAFNTKLGQRFDLRLSNSFIRSPDFSNTNLFHGILFTPEGIFFDTETILLRRNSYHNRASMTLRMSAGPRNSLNFTLGHFVRTYSEAVDFTRAVTDQQQFRVGVGYTRRVSNRTSFGFRYSLSQLAFREFNNAQTHRGTLTFRRELSPTTHLRISAGPSLTRSLENSEQFLKVGGSIGISQAFEENLVSLSYRYSAGDAIGVGSISDTHRLSLNLSRPIGRRTALAASLGGYNTRRRLDNTVETRGYLASARVNLSLTPRWLLGVGATYQNQEGTRSLSTVRRRFYVSLIWQLPELLSFTR